MPIPFTAVNVKKAFMPMPGATIMGFLAYKPIITLQKNDNKTVAVSTAPKGIPVCESMAGLTTIMYMVAKKELIPANISVFLVVGDMG